MFLCGEKAPRNDLDKCLLKLMNEFKDVRLRICTGSTASKPEEVRQSYQNALIAYNHAFLNNLEGICHFEEYDDKINKPEKAVFFNLHEMKKRIGEYHEKDISLYIDEIFEQYKRTDTDRYLIESQCINLLGEMTRSIPGSGIFTESIYKMHGPISSIKNMDCLDDIGIYMKNILNAFIHKAKERNTSDIRPVVKRAIDYASKNVGVKDITIKSIAEATGVSYVYLSKAFKQDIGMNFTEYLNRYRIDISKKYLSETDMKIYEVSYMVGLEPKNYYNLFRKYENITPKEYRRING